MFASTEALAKQVCAGERAAIAHALNTAEDRRPSAAADTRRLLRLLSSRERALRIGLTGPPGAGKSTLAGRLGSALTGSVAILAIDPSSPKSGGAILGDRARIPRGARDGLFIRSIATAGMAGGLAFSVPAAARVLGAAFDIVLIETTGVGQTEVDVRHTVDVVVMLVQPGSGDGLQFVKAGIMEIPDVFVVHKSDLEGADASFAALQKRLSLPVFRASARTGEGIEALAEHLMAFPRRSADARRSDDAAWLAAVFAREFGERAVRRLGGLTKVQESLAAANGDDPVEELGNHYLSLESVPTPASAPRRPS